MANFLELSGFRVDQPLGFFVAIAIKASDLLAISFSEEMQYIDEEGNLKGSQRKLDERRLKEIGKYIDSVEMAFPNSIILGANYDGLTGKVIDDISDMWRFEPDESGRTGKLIVPKRKKLAAIIDGQHRLRAFDFVSRDERKQLDLLCSVYFDLPNSYQAFLFATINANQKKVDKSLALEQFGFNVGDEPETSWTPEKYAVFVSRKLNIDQGSPFFQHIKVAPKNDNKLFKDSGTTSWTVSTATIVEGILGLISTNAKRDRVEMQQTSIFKGRNRKMIDHFEDHSPLRLDFIESRDQLIYDTIVKYFTIVSTTIWTSAPPRSYIFKTVGVQALFDNLKTILTRETTPASDIDFAKYLLPVKNLDFSDKFFQASGIGRSRIRNLLGLASGLIDWSRVKNKDTDAYKNVLQGSQSDVAIDKWLVEDEAEREIEARLQAARWDSVGESVELDLGQPTIIKTLADLYEKLLVIAKEAAIAKAAEEGMSSSQYINQFDPSTIVKSTLFDYVEQIKEIGWESQINTIKP